MISGTYLKTSLHNHSDHDPFDGASGRKLINFSPYNLIDRAAALNYQVLALTHHGKLAWDEQWKNYAQTKNILLIPGLELYLTEQDDLPRDPRTNKPKSWWKTMHTLILNCETSTTIEEVHTFRQLEGYKKKHPEIFVIAPHPFFYIESLGKKLEKYLTLFDAIEISRFYCQFINYNKKAVAIAKKYNLPFIATTDTHKLEDLETNYCLIEAQKNPTSIFAALRAGKFQNISTPMKLKDFLTSFFKVPFRKADQALISLNK